MKKFRKLPSPAMIVALVALTVALGGSAYAATKIGTKQIRNGAVTQAKLSKRLVTARSWARIDGETGNPTVTATGGTRITGVEQGTLPGWYCIQTSYTPKAAIAQDEFTNGYYGAVSQPGRAPLVCPEDTEASVGFFDESGNVEEDENFTIVLF